MLRAITPEKNGALFALGSRGDPDDSYRFLERLHFFRFPSRPSRAQPTKKEEFLPFSNGAFKLAGK